MWTSSDTESIQTYLNNKRLQPDSDSYQFIHLKKAHQIFIHTGLTGKYKLQLFCHNGISSEVNLINGAASIADFNLLPFYRRENKEQRIFKCRFFAFKNKRLKAISKYHRIHLPQPNIDIKIIDTSKWPKQKTHRHQFVGKVLRRMVIKNLGHEAYVLKIPLPVRQNAELNVFAREGSQIQKIGPKNIGLKYKLHWESKKALGKNLLKNNRHLIEVRLVPQAFILVDVSV